VTDIYVNDSAANLLQDDHVTARRRIEPCSKNRGAFVTDILHRRGKPGMRTNLSLFCYFLDSCSLEGYNFVEENDTVPHNSLNFGFGFKPRIAVQKFSSGQRSGIKISRERQIDQLKGEDHGF
jgi:hypothetical protein